MRSVFGIHWAVNISAGAIFVFASDLLHSLTRVGPVRKLCSALFARAFVFAVFTV